MAWHSNYWSCSKFADIIRGTPKLNAGTSKEWSTWKKEAKAEHPIRFWLAEEGLNYLQDFVTWPITKLNDIRYYINNRWITKSHALTAHPQDIKPGHWQDLGNRFLPCMFNELVDYVEVECAWHNVMCDKEARKKYNPPWWRRGWLRLRAWRCPEAGLDYLNWSASLVINEEHGVNPGEEGYGEPLGQAEAAKEILALYRWWTEVYRNRPDPYDASGWSAVCAKMREDDPDDFLGLESTNEELVAERDLSHDVLGEIEKAYEDEEEQMMIRLIKIRGALWT